MYPYQLLVHSKTVRRIKVSPVIFIRGSWFAYPLSSAIHVSPLTANPPPPPPEGLQLTHHQVPIVTKKRAVVHVVGICSELLVDARD